MDDYQNTCIRWEQYKYICFWYNRQKKPRQSLIDKTNHFRGHLILNNQKEKEGNIVFNNTYTGVYIQYICQALNVHQYFQRYN